MRQITSLLSSVTSLLISPEHAYLSSLVLPTSQYSSTGCQRAFSADGRLAPVKDLDTGNGFKFKAFEVLTTARDFEHSRRSARQGEKLVPSNLAAVWTPHCEETLIGGVLQGRKLGDPKGASLLSRRRMWLLAKEVGGCSSLTDVARGFGIDDALGFPEVEKYSALKNLPLLIARRLAKTQTIEKAMTSWMKNSEDNFTLIGMCD